MGKKKLIFIVLGILIAVYLILLIISFITGGSTTQPEDEPIFPSPTISSQIPTTQPLIINAPDSTLNIPTQSPNAGGGVDLEAQRTQASIRELEKIRPILPYYETFTLSTGVEVSISISRNLLAARPWVLTVFIDGIDFHVPANDPAYGLYRTSFREAAAITLAMLDTNGVNTSLIYINWGDEAFVQERAELWLQ